jgi:hypothetical protein
VVSHPDEPASDPPTDEPDPAPTRRRRRTSAGQALGGAIVGFDYQVFRATKPPAELVEHAAPVRGLSAADGGLLTIGLSDDEPGTEPERPADAPPPEGLADPSPEGLADPPPVASSGGLR